ISITSRKPSVVTSAVRAPRRSSSAFVATVVPCASTSTAPTPEAASAADTPAAWRPGTEGTFAVTSSPPTTATRSVNVPPTSTPTETPIAQSSWRYAPVRNGDDEDALEPRDRPVRDAPPDRGARRRARARGGRGRALRPLQGEGRPRRARAARRPAEREADRRHRDHADEGGRGEDDDVGRADAGPREDREEAGALPARGVARAGVRDQGRRGRRRLRAGRADGGPQPPLHRGHPRDRGRQQPALGDARGAH